jgi:hypothetical protein
MGNYVNRGKESFERAVNSKIYIDKTCDSKELFSKYFKLI